MNDRDLVNVTLTREELKKFAPLADRMIVLQQALNEVGIQNSDLKSIEATGGTMHGSI